MDEEHEYGQETNIDDAIEAFMKSNAEEIPADDEEEDDSEEVVQEDTEEEHEEDEADEADSEGSDEDETEEEEAVVSEADDEAVVKVTVNGEEKTVAVKDLKRLFGQEASLTQKSQAISNQRRSLEAQGMYLAKILNDRHIAAKANAEKYKDVDLFRASRELEPDEFDALRSAKEHADTELNLIEKEAHTFMENARNTRASILKEQAKESLKEITKAIPDWSDEVYGKVRTYAMSQGLDRDTVNEIVDPGAIVMIHKAMRYDEAQRTKETVVKKVVKAPKRVVKKAATPTDTKNNKMKQAERNAASSGEIDDVAALFEMKMKERN